MPDCASHKDREACAQVMYKDGSHKNWCRGCLNDARAGAGGLDHLWQDNVIMFYPAFDPDLEDGPHIMQVAEAAGPGVSLCRLCGAWVDSIDFGFGGVTYRCAFGHTWSSDG